MVAHNFDPSTWEAELGSLCEAGVNLFCRVGKREEAEIRNRVCLAWGSWHCGHSEFHCVIPILQMRKLRRVGEE